MVNVLQPSSGALLLSVELRGFDRNKIVYTRLVSRTARIVQSFTIRLDTQNRTTWFPQFKATAKLGEFLEARFSQSF